MSTLPSDRVSVDPSFTHTGLDVFGPFTVVTRKTRGHNAENKRWAVIFSCLITRAVHLEVVESLLASSFICALRCFLAIRGSVKLFRSNGGQISLERSKNFKRQSVRVERLLAESTWTFGHLDI